MSEEKPDEHDPEKTLLTLDQLSQTIEVMTSVVNRLRRHLSEQLQAQALQKEAEASRQSPNDGADVKLLSEQPNATIKTADSNNGHAGNDAGDSNSFVVEIKQQEADPARKNNKTLH